VTTLTACRHCGAILDDSPVCAICRKSPLQPVEEVDLDPGTGPHEPRPRVTAITATAGIIAVLTLIWAWTRSDDSTTVAPKLPTPTTLDPSFLSDGTAPSVADGPPTTAPATGSSVVGSDTSNGLAPWETPGLDDVDYGESQTHVAELLDALPGPWSVTEPAAIGTDETWVDLATAEATRPFAARSLAHSTAGPIGQIWIMSADPDDPGGVDFVRRAQTELEGATVVETVDGGPGLELLRIESELLDVWVARYETPTQVIFFVRRGTAPSLLLAFLEDWRLADLQLS
jgi:hypothetical protein